MYIYIYMNHFVEHWNVTQHCKWIVLQLKKRIGKKLKKGYWIDDIWADIWIKIKNEQWWTI